MADCRAKDPSSCRVHGTQAPSLEELQARAAAASARGDSSEYLDLRAQIVELTRPAISPEAMKEILEAFGWEEDDWSGVTGEQYYKGVRTSLEAAVSHVRDGSIPDRFAALVFAQHMWSIVYAPDGVNGDVKMGWDSASPSARKALVGQGVIALNILRKHLS